MFGLIYAIVSSMDSKQIQISITKSCRHIQLALWSMWAMLKSGITYILWRPHPIISLGVGLTQWCHRVIPLLCLLSGEVSCAVIWQVSSNRSSCVQLAGLFVFFFILNAGWQPVFIVIYIRDIFLIKGLCFYLHLTIFWGDWERVLCTPTHSHGGWYLGAPLLNINNTSPPAPPQPLC